MSQESLPVARRQVAIRNALGLHMRPANKFLVVVDRFQSEIRINVSGRSFDGRSIMDLLGLAAEKGTLLDLEACGPDAEAAITTLSQLIAESFYEDDEGNEVYPQPLLEWAAAPAQNGPAPAPPGAPDETPR